MTETETEKPEESQDEKLKNRILNALKKNKPKMKEFSNERIKANNYFYGEPDGKEVEGRSKVISRDVFEVILWQLTDMVRIFLSGQRVAEVSPQGADDIKKAKLMEEKINFDFLKSNPGFKILVQFFMDALLHRLGVVKWFWCREYKYKSHKYYNISQGAYNDLLNEKIGSLDNVNKLEPKHIIDKVEQVEAGGLSNKGVLVEPTYNIFCREKIRKSYPKAVNVPLEEISFNIDMKDRTDPEGVIVHQMRVHKRRLKEYGFDEDDADNEVREFENANAEIQSRFADLGGLGFITDDKDSGFVFLNECYIYDFDESGIPIPKIAYILGNKIGKIQDNEYGAPNFAFITPIILAHRLVGLSTFNTVSDIQEVQTAFLRMILDNGYYQNNGVSIINQYRVDMSAASEGVRPGLKLTMLYDADPNTCIANLPAKPLPAQIVNVHTKIMPEARAGRTGVNRFMQGMDTRSLINRTAGGVNTQMAASQGPRELIARGFAETGVKDIFQGFSDMNIDFLDMEQAMLINKEWVLLAKEDRYNTNPTSGEKVLVAQGIAGNYDITIDVGIGVGTKQDIFNRLMGMLDRYGAIVKTVGPEISQQIFTIEQFKNGLREGWELSGFKDTNRFVLPENIGGVNGNGTGVIPENRERLPIQTIVG